MVPNFPWTSTEWRHFSQRRCDSACLATSCVLTEDDADAWLTQMEFFSEDVPITIIPNFSLPSAERSTLTCLSVSLNLNERRGNTGPVIVLQKKKGVF